ncbi:MAG: class I SAM-dependent methyltransferase [bacterium]
MRTIPQNQGWFEKPLPAPPHFTAPGETQIILQLAGEVEGDILEIGCNVGHTTLNLALRFPTRKIYAIDWKENTNLPTLTSEVSTAKVAENALHMANVIAVNTDSRIYKYPDGIGFIFIDANHQYDYVKVDTMKALAYAASRKVTIMWHDVHSKVEDGPTRVLKELPPEFDVMHIEGTMLAVLKVNQEGDK